MKIIPNLSLDTIFIDEVYGWSSGKELIILKDSKRTEIVVAKEHVKILKEFLGM